MSRKRRDKMEKKNDKDNIRSLNGLKIERQPMQKLKESCWVENLGKNQGLYLKKERAPCKEVCFLPMNSIQAIQSFSQDHTYRSSFVQIIYHQAHPLIYSLCFMHQEIPHKETQIEGIEIVKASPTSHRNNQLREVCNNHANIQMVKCTPLLRHSQRNP